MRRCYRLQLRTTRHSGQSRPARSSADTWRDIHQVVLYTMHTHTGRVNCGSRFHAFARRNASCFYPLEHHHDGLMSTSRRRWTSRWWDNDHTEPADGGGFVDSDFSVKTICNSVRNMLTPRIPGTVYRYFNLSIPVFYFLLFPHF